MASMRQRSQDTPLDRLSASFPGRFRVVELDVNRDEQVQALAGTMETLDVLINNAGVMLEAFGEPGVPDPGVLDQTLRTNAVGPARVTAALLPALRRASRPVVVNITSGLGSIAECGGGVVGYRMSKAALNMFSRCLALDCPDVICVALHPGWVRTDMGGPQATLSVEESCEAMRRFIDHLTPEHSGGFYSYRGERVAW